MGQRIHDLIFLIQKGDNNALINLLAKFEPLLKSTAYYLNKEDGYEELTAFLVELLKTHNFSTIISTSDDKYVSYIVKSVKNYSYKLRNKKSICFEFIDNISSDDFASTHQIAIHDCYERILLEDCKKILTLREFEVIYYIYFLHEPICFITKKLKVSRQTVNTTKLRALQKLKSSLFSNL